MMKSNYGELWGGTNLSGFSGLPGGFRDLNGYLVYAGYIGYWWSSSPNGSNAWYRYLSDYDGSVLRYDYYQRGGFSVRCVRDAE